MSKTIIFLIFILNFTEAKVLQKGFVYIEDEIPNIQLEMRYYGQNNFIGSRIDGYLTPRAILTKEATTALKEVQIELNSFGLGIKIFDSYRPQKAVDHFVRWAKNLSDIKMKDEYYPTVDKKNLFKFGYIAKKSGHSRGSTVDLTIIDLNSTVELDMGSHFDFFGKKSWVKYQKITPNQRANRMLLHTIMTKHGFKSYAEEWWHFTLRDEPYRDSYFNFNVE
ncbi:D-alanyl-D-alanine dipeptidase [hydrothermal vent metagenome]|uniref:D-alanyl-D-alanine dipeptidase n=1 Tax=hydrothermal vent metagenome TaxID=652676 RepID=A0A1W1B9N6_9ZZZZ